MHRVLIFAAFLLVTACSAEPGSTRWCEQKSAQPKNEWSASDLVTYTQHCFIAGTEVGSEEWCKALDQKDKRDWTAHETATYTKNCIM
ncbi:MAG: DUF3012 domain-containing protein [Halioglobus sp.]|nr:DUF3012 domain-containing protein [Halioglobus sp.]